MSKSGVTWSFAYDASGMRTSRTSGSTAYAYTYDGGQLKKMTVGSNALIFTYGINGQPMSVKYNGVDYYYVTNSQGDVVGILNASGTEVVTYTYDAWGNILSTSGSMASTLGAHNPLRYRGYVYDQETGLYYLQSRYYNPTICRFISADTFVSTGQGILSYNMFAYCLNNPIKNIDVDGQVPVPTLMDYYYIHKHVQYDIVEDYGYAMEVRTYSILGKGSLDLYDPTTNQYYEVKSIGQSGLFTTDIQMQKYDVSYICDWRFIGYRFLASPNRGQLMIRGSCQYSYWDISYEANGDGLITYVPKINETRYAIHLAALSIAVAGALYFSMYGSYQGGCPYWNSGNVFSCFK